MAQSDSRQAKNVFQQKRTPAAPVIELRHVTKTYRDQADPVQALRDVSFKVKRGEMVAIMGPSGSGKTTMLNILGLLDTPDSAPSPEEGQIFFEGVASTRLKRRQLPQFRQENVGFVFQQKNLIPSLTALENVYLPFRYRSGKKALGMEQAREALRLVGMLDRADHRPAQLSGGQLQRVAIARALVLSPAVVLADEPTGELDSKNGHAIVALMKGLSRQTNQTFVIVTHNEMVAAACDRVLRMQDGHLKESRLARVASSSKSRKKP